MKLARLCALAAAGFMAAAPALAEHVVPLLSYRTGPYAPNGIPFADGWTRTTFTLAERARRRHRR